MSYTQTDVLQLGARLDSIELADGERAALAALVGFAARNPSELIALGHGDAARFSDVLPGIMFEV